MERLTSVQVRQAREALGLSGAALAERLNVRADTVRRWESGRDPVPYGVRMELIEVGRRRLEEVSQAIAALDA